MKAHGAPGLKDAGASRPGRESNDTPQSEGKPDTHTRRLSGLPGPTHGISTDDRNGLHEWEILVSTPISQSFQEGCGAGIAYLTQKRRQLEHPHGSYHRGVHHAGPELWGQGHPQNLRASHKNRRLAHSGDTRTKWPHLSPCYPV